MKDKISYENAAEMLISLVKPMDITEVKLEESTGMILAEEICALENVPPFDRSPYDGYAFRAEDCLEASRDNPVTLRITEEIPAGSVPSKEVTEEIGRAHV